VSNADLEGGITCRLATPVLGSRAERERLTGRQESVSLPGLRWEVTWENGSWHSGSRWFADTEEVTGSNPVAPTIPLLTRDFIDRLVRLKDWIGREK
jgi:hypothetical protein